MSGGWDHTGNRGVSIDDALAIAAALSVNPAHMLSGTFTGEPIELGGKLRATSPEMLEWFRGHTNIGPGLDRMHVYAPSRQERDARRDPAVAHMLKMCETLVDATAAEDRTRRIDAWEAIRLNAQFAKQDLEREEAV